MRVAQAITGTHRVDCTGEDDRLAVHIPVSGEGTRCNSGTVPPL